MATINLGRVKGDKGDQGLRGIQGEQGIVGLQGLQGLQGDDGLSVTDATINASGHLIITLSDNTTIDAGIAKGRDGTDSGDMLKSVYDTNNDGKVDNAKVAESANSCTGNSATATKLATARTINGVAFDGSANITIADGTKVPTTRTVNAKALSANIVLSGADILATGYAKASAQSAIVVTDSLNIAIGKVEKKADDAIALKASMIMSTTAPSGTLAPNVLHCVYA